MKTNIIFILATVIIVHCSLFTVHCFSQNVGINATGTNPKASAGLDVDFTNKGLLIPRMTTTQRNNIALPAQSLLIYNITDSCYQGYIGNTWRSIWCASAIPPCPLPDAFTTNTATNITMTSFIANWNASAGATAYYLDVATDSTFTSFVTGYNNLNVGNVLTQNVAGLTCATTYYYRVKASNTCGSTYSNIKTVNTIAAPEPIATNATNVTATSFTANWTAVAGAIAYYLDVSTDVIFMNFVTGYNNRNVTNVTTYPITGLTANTIYYYRVRVSNSCGMSANSNIIMLTTLVAPPPPPPPPPTCGNPFTDARDGKTYNTTAIAGSSSPYCLGNSQCWMAQNLNVGTYIIASTPQTNNGTIEKYCYNNDINNCNIYGGMYNWDEMMSYATRVGGNGPGPQGICPTGWHLPTDNEWKCLEMNLGMSRTDADAAIYDRGGSNNVGGKLKEVGTTHWTAPNTGATNSTGFTALPGGSYLGSYWFSGGADFWTTTDANYLSNIVI